MVVPVSMYDSWYISANAPVPALLVLPMTEKPADRSGEHWLE